MAYGVCCRVCSVNSLSCGFRSIFFGWLMDSWVAGWIGVKVCIYFEYQEKKYRRRKKENEGLF
jgi:hypothetical protein